MLRQQLLAASCLLLLASPARATPPSGPPSGPPAAPPSAPPSDPPSAPLDRNPAPYHDLSQAGSGFWGPGRESEPATLPATVKVGLFGPERSVEGIALRRGAELALQEANAGGGCCGGLPFALVFRADDGAWGTAAPRVVALTHEDRVWAIAGGLDGHRAHLAELVAAKLWVPVIIPWAADRTIDYANVPWVFRVAPDDGRQADLLLRFAREQGAAGVRVLAEEDRDARISTERVVDAARRLGLPPPEVRTFSPLAPPEETARAAREAAGASPLLVWARPGVALPVLHALRSQGFGGLLLAPGTLALPEAVAIEGLVVASPFDLTRPSPALAAFFELYRSRFGEEPSPLAVLAYDTMALTLHAIRAAGLNRARIRDALARTDHAGLSGRIRFDGLGGNPAEPVLLQARGGRWEAPAR